MRRLAAGVLVMEAVVLLLAIPVAIVVQDVSVPVGGGGGAVLVITAVVLAGLLRYRWAYEAASVLQLLVIATGVVVPAMFFLGACFAILWIVTLWLGSSAERQRKA